MIKNKWKLFALRHHLSDWSGDAVALFDELETEEDLLAVFKKYDVIAWYPFQYMESDNPEELASIIVGMADQAQITENQEG